VQACRRVFSSRLSETEGINELTRALLKRRRAGGEILDLTESNPTHAGIAYEADRCRYNVRLSTSLTAMRRSLADPADPADAQTMQSRTNIATRSRTRPED